MIKLVTVEQMRAIEAATDRAGVSYDRMMQNAGLGVARVIRQLLGKETAGKRVAVLVGPGNNGGDGLVAARIIRQETEAEVGAYLLKPRGDDEPVFAAARGAGVFIADADSDQRGRVLTNLVASADILVDALLGTGARLPIKGDLAKLMKRAAAALQRLPDGSEEASLWLESPAWPGPIPARRTLVVAVDCPSGLDCDSGEIDPLTIPADVTVTFAAAKVGQVRMPGAAAVGHLIAADIGTPADLAELETIPTELATGRGVGRLLPARPADSHKGTFGRALLVGGSVNYTGAMALAAEAAYRVGAGLVTLAVPQPIHVALAARLVETTWLLLPHEMGVINAAAFDVLSREAGRIDALLVGPGMGHDEATADFVQALLAGGARPRKGSIGFGRPEPARTAPAEKTRFELPHALVIDADGLNLLAGIDNWWELLPEGTVLTPHPGEMARLSGLERDVIQADRIAVAREKAAAWRCVMVLKGAFTVIAAPDGRVVVLPFATDALATAGTGDVLAGCITGLMAQGVPAMDAAVAGAYCHALAGEIAAAAHGTGRAVVAGDVLEALPEALRRLAQDRQPLFQVLAR
ncbi:MAG: NAD(P)H-hydrate dehydratase [Anaerolineae bacterium]